MIPKFIAAPVVAGIAALVGPCDPPPPHHSVCAETAGQIACTDDTTGAVTVTFPADLWCPSEDSCTANWTRDNQSRGRWVITMVVP